MLEDYLVQQPTATWNSARGVWERTGMANLLCEHWELFSVTWPTSGMTRNGQVFALPMLERLTVGSESSLSPIPEESMLRTPSAIEGQGGAISEDKARERNRMLQVRDQMAQLAAENGLKVSDAIASQLLPTPALGHIRNYDEPVEDYLERRQKYDDGDYRGMPGVSLGVAVRMEMLPTPVAIEGIKGTAAQGAEEKSKTGQVWLTNIAHDFAKQQGLPTPARQNGLPQPELGELEPLSWGKFEPAIRRWEAVLGRPAPEPTKPDGKDGAHRLSSRFTEWMMGLPDGWITEAGLTRVDELKACGNGVVPQQAELALRILLQGIDLSDPADQVNLPTPTVSDVYTSSLTSSQQSEGSMHSVTLPQAVERMIVRPSDKIKG